MSLFGEDALVTAESVTQEQSRMLLSNRQSGISDWALPRSQRLYKRGSFHSSSVLDSAFHIFLSERFMPRGPMAHECYVLPFPLNMSESSHMSPRLSSA